MTPIELARWLADAEALLWSMPRIDPRRAIGLTRWRARLAEYERRLTLEGYEPVRDYPPRTRDMVDEADGRVAYYDCLMPGAVADPECPLHGRQKVGA